MELFDYTCRNTNTLHQEASVKMRLATVVLLELILTLALGKKYLIEVVETLKEEGNDYQVE